jgi:hypothetical protein
VHRAQALGSALRSDIILSGLCLVLQNSLSSLENGKVLSCLSQVAAVRILLTHQGLVRCEILKNVVFLNLYLHCYGRFWFFFFQRELQSGSV